MSITSHYSQCLWHHIIVNVCDITLYSMSVTSHYSQCLWHHIIFNVFDITLYSMSVTSHYIHIIFNVCDITLYSMSSIKQDMQKPLSCLPFHPNYFFPIRSLKLFPLSYNQKSFMKPDTFDSKHSPSSCNTFIFSIILSCSWFAYKNTQKMVQFKKVPKNKRIKYRASKTVLSVWFIQLSPYFYHIW